MLLRIDLEDPGTVATLERCGQAVTDLNRAELIAMVEPFMSSRFGGKIVNDLSQPLRHVVSVNRRYAVGVLGQRGEALDAIS